MWEGEYYLYSSLKDALYKVCSFALIQASSKMVVARIKYIHCKCNGSSLSKSRLCLHVLPKFITFAVVLKGLWKSKDIPPFCFKRNNFKGYSLIFTIHFHIDLNAFHSVAFCAQFIITNLLLLERSMSFHLNPFDLKTVRGFCKTVVKISSMVLNLNIFKHTDRRQMRSEHNKTCQVNVDIFTWSRFWIIFLGTDPERF